MRLVEVAGVARDLRPGRAVASGGERAAEPHEARVALRADPDRLVKAAAQRARADADVARDRGIEVAPSAMRATAARTASSACGTNGRARTARNRGPEDVAVLPSRRARAALSRRHGPPARQRHRHRHRVVGRDWSRDRRRARPRARSRRGHVPRQPRRGRAHRRARPRRRRRAAGRAVRARRARDRRGAGRGRARALGRRPRADQQRGGMARRVQADRRGSRSTTGAGPCTPTSTARSR